MFEGEKYIVLTVLPRNKWDKKRDDTIGNRTPMRNRKPARVMLKISEITAVNERADNEDKAPTSMVWTSHGAFFRVKEPLDDIICTMQSMSMLGKTVVNAKE
jgi:hypothetical protein